jgi:hypothetical protein
MKIFKKPGCIDERTGKEPAVEGRFSDLVLCL